MRPKRFRGASCDAHPTTTPRLRWSVPHALPTTASAHHLLRPWVQSTIEDVCQQEETSDDVVRGTIARWMMTDRDGAAWPPCTVRGMDEMALQTGPRDDVVRGPARLSTGRLSVLAVLPDRTTAPRVTWLTTLPAPLRRPIRTVCTERWQAYVTAVRAVLGQVLIVIDRFQVATHDRDGADTWRQQAFKRLRAALPHATLDQRKPTRGPFRQRPAALEADEQDRLTRVLEHAPPLKPAYDLRAQRPTLFDTARSQAEGRRRIHRWRRAVAASGLTCFAPFRKRLDTWLDLMAHDGRQHQTRGFVEGLHHQLKVLKRRGCGIYHLRHLCPRITLDLDGYRRFSPWQGAHD